MEVLVQLRVAQKAQGTMGPLKEVRFESKDKPVKQQNPNFQEESKDELVPIATLQPCDWEALPKSDDQADQWEAVTRSMFCFLPENSALGKNAMPTVIWKKIILHELNAAEKSGKVPLYLRCLYHMRYPLSCDQLKLQCPTCLKLLKSVKDKTEHMATHVSKKKETLSKHFRKVQRKGRSAQSFDYSCIICGFYRSNVNKVIKHMKDKHTKTQRVRFNVDWIVELHGKVNVPQSPCHLT